MKNSNQRVKLTAEASDNFGKEYRFSIEFVIFRENDLFIAYCPSLDLSSSGESFNDAISNFYEMFQLYIESCVENKTLFADLAAHGWKMQKKTILPPKFSSLAKKPEMKRILNGTTGFEKVVVAARVPMAI